jgi:hypothetical protein
MEEQELAGTVESQSVPYGEGCASFDLVSDPCCPHCGSAEIAEHEHEFTEETDDVE